MSDVVLETRDICKTFPGVRANHNINLQLRRGEVLALLGENGAGKSTLMNILYGFYTPDSGQILVNGNEVVFQNPKEAIRCGIGMVHQHFMLIPVFSVLENIVLGLDLGKGVMLNSGKYRKEILALSETYGIPVQLDAKVAELSIGEQQRVEIVKTLFRQAEILILDEPTAVLTPQESEDLFKVLECFKKAGKSILFISHKMDELMSFSDRIAVLRDGEMVGEFVTRETDINQLAQCMVGREVEFVKNRNTAPPKAPQVVVKNLCAQDRRGVQVLKGIEFEIGEGEILGLAGIDGNGQAELAETLMGLRKAEQGEIFFRGEDLAGCETRELFNKGFGHIPADRKRQGLVLEYTVADNLVLEDIASPRFSAKGFLRHKEILSHAKQAIQEYNIRPPYPENRAMGLSGGNQQKVIAAREFEKKPRFLIAVNPIRGIDISATEFIHKKLLAQKQEGASILLISTDLEEIFNLSDRIAVICHGKIVGVVKPSEATAEQVGLMMTGCEMQRGDLACAR